MNVVTNLIELGLSENQVKVYLYLMEQGEVRVQNIAAGLDMPRSSVYQNLKGLRQQGLVEEIVDHKIIRYKAYPLTMLTHRLNEKLALVSEIEEEIKKLVSLPKQSIEIRYYKGVTGARQLFWNTLKAKTPVLVYSAYGRSKFVGKKFYTDFVARSLAIPIQEKVLINPTEETLEMIRVGTHTPLARTQIRDLRSISENIVSIKGETFIYNNTFAVIYLKNREISGFEIEHPEFAATQKNIFETLWSQANPIDVTTTRVDPL